MKKQTLLLAFLSILAFACEKKEEAPAASTTTTTGNSPTPTAILSYNDGSETISVDSARAVLYTLGVAPFNREIDVYAYKSGKTVLEFHFLPKTGNQTVAQNFSGAWLTYKTNNGASYPEDYFNCTSGNFNLSTCDTVGNKIIGTFDFVGNNGTVNKTITAGTINLTQIKKQ